MLMANNILARITTALGLAPTYAVDKVVDTTKSNYIHSFNKTGGKDESKDKKQFAGENNYCTRLGAYIRSGQSSRHNEVELQSGDTQIPLQAPISVML